MGQLSRGATRRRRSSFLIRHSATVEHVTRTPSGGRPSKGDRDLILSAGFETEKVPAPIGELHAPPNVRAEVTLYPGRVDVKWGGVRGRMIYEVWMTDGDPKVEANWKLQGLTSKNRMEVEGLTSNTVYYFRVVAQGAAGPSPMSDVAFAKAA